jgi:hypothetical protein
MAKPRGPEARFPISWMEIARDAKCCVLGAVEVPAIRYGLLRR